MKAQIAFLSRLLRIKHWSKQSFVFLGFIFSAHWSEGLYNVFVAAFAFSLAASSIYLYNDIEDIEQDRKHPEKSKRPIASGDVQLSDAYLLMFVLNILSFVLALTLSLKAVFVISLYLLINIFYSNGLKHIPYVDVMCLSQGFLLRILMGTWAIDIPPSMWILLCGTALSVFLALSKRKLEWTKQQQQKEVLRPVLAYYSPFMLNTLLAVSSIVFLMAYFLYAVLMTYYLSPGIKLVITLPFVAAGFSRYLYLLRHKPHTDCPVSLFLHDKVSVANLACMVVACVFVLKHGFA